MQHSICLINTVVTAHQMWLLAGLLLLILQMKLWNKYKVTSIPSLVFVDAATGKVVCRNGLLVVRDDPKGEIHRRTSTFSQGSKVTFDPNPWKHWAVIKLRLGRLFTEEIEGSEKQKNSSFSHTFVCYVCLTLNLQHFLSTYGHWVMELEFLLKGDKYATQLGHSVCNHTSVNHVLFQWSQWIKSRGLL